MERKRDIFKGRMKRTRNCKFYPGWYSGKLQSAGMVNLGLIRLLLSLPSIPGLAENFSFPSTGGKKCTNDSSRAPFPRVAMDENDVDRCWNKLGFLPVENSLLDNRHGRYLRAILLFGADIFNIGVVIRPAALDVELLLIRNYRSRCSTV